MSDSQHENQTGKQGPGRTLVVGAICLGTIAVSAWWGHVTYPPNGAVYGLVFGLLLPVPVFIFMMQSKQQARHDAREARDATRRGEIDFKAAPSEIGRGERVACTLRMKPAADLQLKGAFVLLIAEKTEIHRPTFMDSRAYTTSTVLVKVREPLTRARPVRAGESLELGAELQIPSDAPLSACAESWSVTWRIEAHIGIQGMSDWEGSDILEVVGRPRPRGVPPGPGA